MKVGKVFLVTAVLAFTSIMILAFLPVSSRRYRIEFDEAKIEGKRDYLEEITRSDLPQKQERSIFASDNGGALHTGATENARLKGGKFTNFEGGLNIPFMLRWEGVLAPGTRYTQPVSLMDVFASTAAASGTPLPADREFDGVDLLPYLLEAEHDPPHRALFWRALYNKAVRRGDWKLIVNERSGQILLHNLLHDRREKVLPFK